ncbi:nucleotidyltransferase domain-containing protein [Chitinophaga nivalis]|uniref:Nucleotidyltransferase domain-containing protein n=1 Tax=Chitinophaga nivalis TaxID=2991709 RepID=A0ABT3IKY6_9BACT|nr:nucleotidyltransferase domain-containing protein [Chitinophaga nivalis]MCW3465721.1 nucleotidyltransferase domain-containing protein [Chitinophaga nivalis]MCW3484588.1 nucleotidyltransferase domain-containing protein [Chitinophaga nivalis]
MEDIILEKIKAIEAEHQVKILYACESGSRAWGFASPDSDYDVRFIYTRHINDYLSITDLRDVIELPVNEVLDVSGWDLKKGLQLFLKSNAPLYEWLQSPIVYQETSDFRQLLNTLREKYYSPRAACHHYLSMAWNTFSSQLQGPEVKLKKYFYVLRPMLACQWILAGKGVPPMEFSRLRTLITDDALQQEVEALLRLKADADESTYIAPIAALHNWIAYTLDECKIASAELPVLRNDTVELNSIFRKYISNDN